MRWKICVPLVCMLVAAMMLVPLLNVIANAPITIQIDDSLASNEELTSPNILTADFETGFLENLGQVGEGGGDFYAMGQSLSISFGTGWYAYNLNNAESGNALVRVEFIGCNEVDPTGARLLKHFTNFFIGNEPSSWVSEVRSYAEVHYEDIWDDIDLRFYFNGDLLKCDFIVRPGGRPSDIQLGYQGLDKLALDKVSGDLRIITPIGEIYDHAPYSYESRSISDWPSSGGICVLEDRKEVPCSYKLIDEKTLTFQVGNYDVGSTLVIDPEIKFGSFLGGSSSDEACTVFTDDSGDVFLSGRTTSSGFPTTTGVFDTTHSGSWDVFVTKMKKDLSSIEYSTFVGGTGQEMAYEIRPDESGNVYVVGTTESSDFPTTSGAFDTTYGPKSDVFLFKLSDKGSKMVYSTYIGGSESEEGFDLEIDPSGYAYIAGHSISDDFPTTTGAFDTSHNGYFDAFALKMSKDGSSLVYSTFFGGTGRDEARGLALGKSGDVYVSGFTYSSGFPTTTGAYDTTHNGEVDIFSLRLNAQGSSLVYSTLIGSSGGEFCFSNALDSSGCAYVIGYTHSSNYPITTGAYGDSFAGGPVDAMVTKVSSDGSSLDYSTYIGGNSRDEFFAIDVDDRGFAYLSGYTSSTDYPVTSDAYDSSFSGSMDAMFAILNKGGTDLIYSTYLGTASYDRAENIKLSGSKYVYVVGFTDSSAFPVKSGSYDTTHNGGRDIFVLGWSTPNRPPTASGGIDMEVSLGTPIDFDGSGSSDLDGTIVSYDWDFGDGTAHGSGATPTHLYTDHGTYNVILTVTDDDGATDTDTCVITVLNNPPTSDAGLDQTVYLGTTVSFDGSGSSDVDGSIVSYDWDFGDGTIHGTGVSTSHYYNDHGVYTVKLTVTDNDGAIGIDTCVVQILNNPPFADAGGDQTLIVGETGSFDGTGSYDVDGTIVSYKWDFGDGTGQSSGSKVTHAYSSSGTYTVTLTVTDDDGDTDFDTLVVEVLTPSQAIDVLIGIKEAMGLAKGLETSLDAKLDAAQASLANGNDETAINQLKAFINEVDAQRDKGLTDAQADTLKAYSQWIIDNI